jgi:tetratricopeptide (TPR) repeat protein
LTPISEQGHHVKAKLDGANVTTPRTPPTGSPDVLPLAVDLHRQGRLTEAARLYRQVLQRNPNRTQALYLLGITELATGKFQKAANLIARSIRTEAGFAPAHVNLGIALMCLGRNTEALGSFDRAIAIAPDFTDAHYNRGILLKDVGRHSEALASFDITVAQQPSLAEAHNNRGLTLNAIGRHQEALACFDRAIALRPDLPEAHHNRGNEFIGLDRPDDALACFDRAIALRPDLAEAWCNRGDSLTDLKRPEEALASFDKAIALRPNLAEAHFGRSLTRLLVGQYEQGFRDFEWRLRRTSYVGRRSLPRPVWLGDRDIRGRTLFIYPELFLGDMIQFCRYAKLVEGLGANVVLGVQAPLRPLLASLSPGIVLIDENALPDHYDFHCPLMSLPLAFRTTMATVPGDVPYLHPEPGRVAAWRQRIGTDGFRVGICWLGSAASITMGRSFPLALLADIARLPGTRLISLQTRLGSEKITELPAGMVVEDFADETTGSLRPFTETAAMMANLDLIITADTAIAHLAGALGRPTWVALKQVPDWRWGLESAATAWYPTWRLFRQMVRNEWPPVFAAMQEALVTTSGVIRGDCLKVGSGTNLLGRGQPRG